MITENVLKWLSAALHLFSDETSSREHCGQNNLNVFGKFVFWSIVEKNWLGQKRSSFLSGTSTATWGSELHGPDEKVADVGNNLAVSFALGPFPEENFESGFFFRLDYLELIRLNQSATDVAQPISKIQPETALHRSYPWPRLFQLS